MLIFFTLCKLYFQPGNPYRGVIQYGNPYFKDVVSGTYAIISGVIDTCHSESTLINESEQLRLLVETLALEPTLAVDTESNSLHAYQEQVCLIQFSTPEDDYLLDPLVLDDLSLLAPIFADPQIEKVFHAAEYDLICLRRDFDFSFANIFDTMVAARILGWRKVGLASILEAQYGVQVNKRYQRANWGERPLTNRLLAYARLDTHYLIPLRNRLYAELQRSGFWPLAKEDFRRACQVNGPRPKSKETMCWRIKGSHDLTPRQAAVLQALCHYRELKAETMDRPVFKVLNDRTLLTLSIACPRNRDELREVVGMSGLQIRRHGAGVLTAVKRGLKADPLHYPRHSRPPGNVYLWRVEALRNWRKAVGQSLGFESDIVLPRDLLYKIARQNPLDEKSLTPIMDQVPWRLNRFGDEILKVLREEAYQK